MHRLAQQLRSREIIFQYLNERQIVGKSQMNMSTSLVKALDVRLPSPSRLAKLDPYHALSKPCWHPP